MNFDQEIKKFTNIASQWWDENGKFSLLHKINPLRISFIRDNSCKFLSVEKPKILDIGCGGGILTESLCEIFMDSEVIGIDAGKENIDEAISHATLKNFKNSPNYINSKFEDFALNESNSFDIICAIEVIEHVEDPYKFMDLMDSILNPGGLIFLSTINRNIKSYLSVILIAEYILRLLPKKTHSWSKFLKPHEISCYFMKNFSYQIIQMSGIKYDLCKSKWVLNNSLDVNYILCLKKK